MTPTDATRPADGPGPDSGHAETHDAREGLRGLLGGRAEPTFDAATRAVQRQLLRDTGYDAVPDERSYAYSRILAGRALYAVLPDLLAEAWDGGKYSDHSPACRWAENSDCICVNPYRTEGTNS